MIPAGATWASSHDFAARELLRPADVADLQRIMRTEPRVRALGSRHSFSDIADSDGVLVSLGEWADRPRLDGDVVRIPGGMTYAALALWLEERGRALGNLASLPHISVAGAVATGTHGSGRHNGSLATSVRALEMVDGTGELVRLERGQEGFDGAVVAVGALGVVTALELDTEPTFPVTQTVHEGLTWESLVADPAAVLGVGYSVSVFTAWTGGDGDSAGQVWVKARGEEPVLPGARPVSTQQHMIAGMDPTLTTPQLGVAGPWYERLPHFRIGFQPSSGAELQSEYLVPMTRAPEALTALRGLADDIAEVLLVAEIRAVAADELWLSGAYGTELCALHFTWQQRPADVAALLPRMEEALLPLGTRPHWGKLFAAQATELAPLYPRWDDFAALLERHDPDRRLTNAWTARCLGR